MELAQRRCPYVIPSYSLTGDVLSFRRCGLQYRYYNRSALPPSRPVQMWTGEFLHSVLEDAYRLFETDEFPFPWDGPTAINELPNLKDNTSEDWPRNHLSRLGLRAELRLKAAGRTPRNREARLNAYQRAREAINILGPDLFPLITAAEEQISGTNEFIPPPGSPRNTDRYELTGIVDVISSVSLREHADKRFVQIIQSALPPASDEEFDVIVDYKGMRRPSRPQIGNEGNGGDPALRVWDDHDWQLQTYGHLRNARQDATHVACGVIVYLNELFPSRRDLAALKKDVEDGTTDVMPEPGSAEFYAISGIDAAPDDANEGDVDRWGLSQAFRIARATRVVPIDAESRQQALGRIHEVVVEIEQRVSDEHGTANIIDNWPATGTRRDCVACDFRHSCPNPSHIEDGANRVPRAPG